MDNELFANVTELPAVIEALEKALFQALKEGQIVNYVIMASYMCMVYDAVLTFEDEFEFIWSFRFSKSSVLYIVMHYGNIIEEGISLAYAFWPGAPFLFCKVWYYIGEWVAYSLFIPTTIFLGLRTYALFREKGPAYKWLIISLVAAVNCISFVAISIATRNIKFSPIPIPNLTCQFNIVAPPYATGVIQFSICAVFDFGIFILTAYRVYEHYKTGNRRLTLLLFKDSLLYYSVLSCGELAMLLLYILLPKEHIQFRALLITPLKCMCVIIASRIVLNIRKLVLHPTALTIDSLITPPEAAMYNATATDVSSAMVFASPQLPGSDDA